MLIHHGATTMLGELFVLGLIGHILADWFLQNAWMAENKGRLCHPAAWAHGFIYAVFMAPAFSLVAAAVLGLLHVLIDTRKPLEWWRKIYGQRAPESVFPAFAMIQDQMLHILLIAMACIYCR